MAVWVVPLPSLRGLEGGQALPSPVPLSWVALGVFVVQAGSQRLQDRSARKVLRGDQLQPQPLPLLLLLDDAVHLGEGREAARDVPSEGSGQRRAAWKETGGGRGDPFSVQQIPAVPMSCHVHFGASSCHTAIRQFSWHLG